MGYPVSVAVQGKSVLVVGGGRVATRRVEGLMSAGAWVTVVSPAATERVQEWAAARWLVWHARGYQPSDLDGMMLVLVATDQPAVNARVLAEARQRGVWANGAHEGAASDFTLPAVAHLGAITLAVETGGASPALARALRDHLQATVEPGWMRAAALFRALRPLILPLADEAQRRRFWARLLREVPGALHGPPQAVAAWVGAAARESDLPLDDTLLESIILRTLVAEGSHPAEEGGDRDG